jgi:hypothetical protein
MLSTRNLSDPLMQQLPLVDASIFGCIPRWRLWSPAGLCLHRVVAGCAIPIAGTCMSACAHRPREALSNSVVQRAPDQPVITQPGRSEPLTPRISIARVERDASTLYITWMVVCRGGWDDAAEFMMRSAVFLRQGGEWLRCNGKPVTAEFWSPSAARAFHGRLRQGTSAMTWLGGEWYTTAMRFEYPISGSALPSEACVIEISDPEALRSWLEEAGDLPLLKPTRMAVPARETAPEPASSRG